MTGRLPAGLLRALLLAAAMLASGARAQNDEARPARYQERAVAGLTQVCGDLARIADGTVYCLEAGHPRIFRIRRNGAVDKIFDGEERATKPGSVVSFESLAVANDETLYGASSKENVILRIAAHSRKVVVYAGGYGMAGAADGAGMAAKFNSPGGLVIDATGRLWVADTRNHTIRVVDRKGRVTTAAGVAGQPGRTDGGRASARFNRPERLALAPDGSIVVLDGGTASLRRIDPATFQVDTVAELRGDGCPAGECCANGCNVGVSSLAVDRSGAVFVVGRTGRTYYRVGTDRRIVQIGGKVTGGSVANAPSVRSLVNGAGDTLYAGRSDGLIKLEPPASHAR